MDPVTDEQLDYGDEKLQYHQSGTIPALAEEEMMGEDDEYDDLYNDVNVGEGFLQMQQNNAQTAPSGVGNSGNQALKNNTGGTNAEVIASQEVNNGRVTNEGSYGATAAQFPHQNTGLSAIGAPPRSLDAAQSGRLPEISHNSAIVPQTTVSDRMNNSERNVIEPASLVNPNMTGPKVVPQIPQNMLNSSVTPNVNRPMDDGYMMHPSLENGNTMLFVGELHWWTTDADLENVLIQYGKFKELKFFDERASGKSKGYCQVEFYDPAAASACKEGMNGYVFNGRACVVAFATAQTIKQMGASYVNKNQAQGQPQLQGRNPMNDGAGRGNGVNYPGGDAGRNFGRGGWGRGNQLSNKGPGGGPMRGRGGMGNKNTIGNVPGSSGASGGGAYGPGLTGPGFGAPPGLMHPQGMMGPGFDLAFMGRGAGYGGFSVPAFPGMIPPFPAVNSMGLPGVAPHVNPAFFGRGMTPGGMGMMGTAGMVGPHSGMWNDANNMGGWGGEEHGRGTGESSYGGEDNGSEYGYGEASHDKGARSSAASREKERNTERDWSNNPERRHRDDREHDGERYDRDTRQREDKDRYRDYRHKDRESGYDQDWDRGQSSRSRSRSGVPEDDHRSRSRDADYGKRRRMPSE